MPVEQSSLKKAEEALSRRRAQLMRRDDVAGVGIGMEGERPVIVILVEYMTPKIQNELSAPIEGFSVKFKEVGVITAG